MGSIMTNIILPAQVKGRYVKITPSGLLDVSPAVGMVARASTGGVSGQSASGIAQAAASIAFSLSAIEIYAFNNTVFFTVEGDGKLNTDNKTICSKCYANKRAVAAVNGRVTFKCLPPDGAAVSSVRVFRNNVDISSSISADGTVTLTDVNTDTDIIVKFVQ
jgi:hypothetical protein